MKSILEWSTAETEEQLTYVQRQTAHQRSESLGGLLVALSLRYFECVLGSYFASDSNLLAIRYAPGQQERDHKISVFYRGQTRPTEATQRLMTQDIMRAVEVTHTPIMIGIVRDKHTGTWNARTEWEPNKEDLDHDD